MSECPTLANEQMSELQILYGAHIEKFRQKLVENLVTLSL